jgi:hypothetical protein
MALNVFPADVRGLGYTVQKSPEFTTIVQQGPQKDETRIAQQKNPIWHFQLIYNYLKDTPVDPYAGNTDWTDLQTMMGFYLQQQGRLLPFLLDDIKDDWVGPAVYPDASPNTNTQLVLVDDGSASPTYFTPLQRRLGGLFFEDITDLNPGDVRANTPQMTAEHGGTVVAGTEIVSGALEVYANGALQTLNVDYSVEGPFLAVPGASYMGLYLQWAAKPTEPVTAQFGFYQRVRFEEDRQDFTRFMEQLWAIGGPNGSGGSGYLRMISSRRPAV